jgi:hypothetical protein
MTPPIFVAVTTADGAISKTIRTVTDSDVSHATLVYWSEDMQDWWSLGSMPQGTIGQTLTEFERNEGCRIVRMYDLSMSADLWHGLRHPDIKRKIGRKYDTRGLFGQGLVEFGNRLGLKVKNPMASAGLRICSRFAAEVVEASGLRLGIDVESVTPKLLDEVLLSYAYAGKASVMFEEGARQLTQSRWDGGK